MRMGQKLFNCPPSNMDFNLGVSSDFRPDRGDFTPPPFSAKKGVYEADEYDM